MFQIIVGILIVMCGILTFLACYDTPLQTTVKSVTTSILLDRMKASKSRYFNYDRLDMFIKSHGVAYMMSESINPVSYIVIKIICGVALGSLIFVETGNIVLLLVCLLVGFFGVDSLVRKKNDADNEKMLSDISNIYDNLKTQLNAGVFITDSIYSCYKSCKNKRLKDGLLLLYLDIQSSSNINEALRRFDARFKNTNLSTLCAVLEQYLITGQAVIVLDNISKKNTAVQRVINEQYKKKINTKFNVLSIMVVLGMFAVIFLMINAEFTNALSQF